MLLTDPLRSRLEGNYAAYSWATLVIYGCFAINVLLGRVLLRHSSSTTRIVSVAVLGSIQFYIFTNLYEWWAGIPHYAHTLSGLLLCYTEALPFFGRTVLGDVFYTAALFASYALLKRTPLFRLSFSDR